MRVEQCTLFGNPTGLRSGIGGNPGQLARGNVISASGNMAQCIWSRGTALVELDSNYNRFHVSNGASVGAVESGNRYPDLKSWSDATGRDTDSSTGDPFFVDPANGDFHLQSSGGSYHHGAWTSDVNESPGLDSGSPTMYWGDEPVSNGQFANAGAYGGTEQASRTPARRTLKLLLPVGGDKFTQASPSIHVQWSCAGSGWQNGDTVRLEYSDDNGGTWSAVPGASAIAAKGYEYTWQTSGVRSPRCRLRIISNQDTLARDETDYAFRIGAEIIYYINDASQQNDAWCTAAGNDSNDGLSPAKPRSTIQGILADYDLEAGDIVRIETGEYNLSNDINVTQTDAGTSIVPVTFEASPYGVTINRGTTSSGYGWNINADYVRLTTATNGKFPSVPHTFMRVMGARYGVWCESEYGEVSRIEVAHNVYGIHVGEYFVNIQNCLVRDNTNTGIACNFPATVENCTIVNNGIRGIDVWSSRDVVLKNNIVIARGAGASAIYLNRRPVVCDFNLLLAENNAIVGYSSGNLTDLAAWRLSTGFDSNSISTDPLFVNEGQGNYHLSSVVGSYHGGSWLADAVHSPAIDAGSPSSTWLHEPLPSGGRVNLGAYGNSEQASKSAASAFSIDPSGWNYGTVIIGSSTDAMFVVRNVGVGTLSGTILVPQPFSVVSGGSFTGLSPGQAHNVTVRFSPTTLGIQSNEVVFSGGTNTVRRAVTGRAIIAPPPLPAKVTGPSPVNAASGMATNALITWSTSTGATGYRIYFGTNTNPPLARVQTGVGFTTNLAPLTTYYWRVDATNSTGVVMGDVWSFTTLAASAGVVQFEKSRYVSSEDDHAGARVTITRGGGSFGNVSVAYASVSGSAFENEDFMPVTGVLNWSNGDTSSRVVIISLVDDEEDEGPESFMMALFNPVGCSLGVNTTAVVMVRDDERSRPEGDFDGDGISDIGCYFPPPGHWYRLLSTAGFKTTQFGFAGTLPIVGDWDGDGQSDYGCYHPPQGNWYRMLSAEGFKTTQFGFDGTLPIVGDWDGDGKDDYGCYFPPLGNWYRMLSTEGFKTTQFGFGGTTPIVGDWDGDGKDDYGCYYPPLGNWYRMLSTEGFKTTQFGFDGTIPIVGDWDGDGRDDYGCYYPPSGNWYRMLSSQGFKTTQFGFSGTIPIVGDWDGDGKDDFGCYFPPLGNWYLMMSSEGFTTTQFGFDGTIPLGR